MRTVVFLASIIAVASAHGWLKYPLARTAIHKFDDVFDTQPPYYFDYLGLWCGNVEQYLNYSTCGRCGEMPGNRDASQGGIYDKGVIVANWTSGSIVEIKVQIAEQSNPHYGQIHLELCDQEIETNTCFKRLEIMEASEPVRIDNSICITNSEQHEVRATVRLPQGFKCNKCTVRWTYRTNFPAQEPYPGWAPCDVRNIATQAFRNCADVAIF